MSLFKTTSMLSGLAVMSILALGPAPASAADELLSGTFKGAGGHKSSGTVQIIKDGKVTKIVFGKNFRLDGAPDPKIAFGNGRYVPGTIFTKLKKLKGEQEYVIPARLKLSKFNQVWLWCERYNAPLGVAALKKPPA